MRRRCRTQGRSNHGYQPARNATSGRRRRLPGPPLGGARGGTTSRHRRRPPKRRGWRGVADVRDRWLHGRPRVQRGEVMAITRVCIYTRISTDEENQPTSLHSQRERLQTFCTAQEGWRIVAHKQDQATGTKLDRPGLQAALDLARAGAVDMLLVYRVDRLSRKVRQLAQLAEELDTLNVVLRSATEPFDTGSAAGRMMLQMLAVFAEFEHATIVDRVTSGIERRAREGRWPNGRIHSDMNATSKSNSSPTNEPHPSAGASSPATPP